MTLTRRHMIASLVPALLPALARAAYPEKAINVVVPFPPGGRTDLMARLLVQSMQKFLPQSMVINNKPGAGGAIGARDVATAASDGHTLGVFSTAAVTAQ